MTTLTRRAFLQEMQHQQIDYTQALNDTRLQSVDFSQIITQNNIIQGSAAMTELFRAIDELDVNGSYYSVNLGTPAHPTTVGKAIQAIRELAHPQTNTPPNPSQSPQDKAFQTAFGQRFQGDYQQGARGLKVVAIQYALGRLGYLHDLCDGSFGGRTQQALKDFQRAYGLSATGIADIETLQQLDHHVAALDLRPPVLKSNQKPLDYLSDFQALGLPNITIDRRNENTSWDSPEVQRAYAEFIGHYWEVLKTNRVEADCKALALFFMDQFRKKLREDTLIELPLPRSPNGSFRQQNWVISTRHRTRGFFSRVADAFRRFMIRVGRYNYKAIEKVQSLDPEHSMIYGVNVKYPYTSADQVARAATTLIPWHNSFSNHGNLRKAEIPINQLQVGQIIFMDHTGDGRYDHTVNIIHITRDANQQVRQLVLAVGSFDDVRDSLASTQVTSMAMVNQYAEEVVVDFDERGLITQSAVTYSSEPDYLVKPRYHAENTLMEKKSGGKLMVCRWG
ncbi:MAG: peptidoglycan-binding domain-containing protein [bacterium]